MTSAMIDASTPDSAVPSTSTSGSTIRLLNSTSQRSRGHKSSASINNRPALIRQPNVRNQPVSHPVPHVISQIPRPAPMRESSQKDLYHIDRRSIGSEDWTKAAKKKKKPGHLKAVRKTRPFSRAEDGPTTSRGLKRCGQSFYYEGSMF